MARIITVYKTDFSGVQIKTANIDGAEAALNTVKTSKDDSGALAISGD